jgi:hypothetical protein
VSATITVQYVIPEDVREYLEANARVRGVSQTQLMRKVMEYVLRDRMILSILDDADRPGPKTAPIRNTRGPRTIPAMTPLAEAREKQLRRAPPVVQRKVPVGNAQTFSFKCKVEMTKSELQEQLRQAVLNTGGVEVE